MAGSEVVVVDLGAANVRACIASTSSRFEPLSVPNLSAKAKGKKAAAIADEVINLPDVSSVVIRRPHDRGYLVNVDLESQILDRVFKEKLKIKSTKGGSLLCSEPLFALPSIQHMLNELVFEKFEFERFLPLPAPFLTAYGQSHLPAWGSTKPPETFSFSGANSMMSDIESHSLAKEAQCGIVVDAGYSFTHAVPFLGSQILMPGVKRLDFGGKAMTNLLKEIVSYRSINMMDETYIIDDVKERLCFVAQNIDVEAHEAKKGMNSSLYREYVLPDGVKLTRGHVRDVSKTKSQAGAGSDDDDDVAPSSASEEEQYIPLCNERFMIPEVLFQPSDIGIEQAGVAEIVTQAVRLYLMYFAFTHGTSSVSLILSFDGFLHYLDDQVESLSSSPSTYGILYSNIILSGGCTTIPGFVERFNKDLRSIVPSDFDVHVSVPHDPQGCALAGGYAYASSTNFETLAFFRAQYFEEGPDRMMRSMRF